MLSNRPQATFWISTWWPVAVAVAIIVIESTAFMGADHTSIPLRRLCETLFGRFSDARWEHVHHYIRKSGHFLGYGMVGLAWLRAWWRALPRRSFLFCAVLALLWTFFTAGADEWHQSYLPNRTGMFRDVLLDCFGAVILMLLDYVVLLAFRRHALRSHQLSH